MKVLKGAVYLGMFFTESRGLLIQCVGAVGRKKLLEFEILKKLKDFPIIGKGNSHSKSYQTT